jgi:glycerol-3-phosphate acyltransferase PlsY
MIKIIYLIGAVIVFSYVFGRVRREITMTDEIIILDEMIATMYGFVAAIFWPLILFLAATAFVTGRIFDFVEQVKKEDA